MRQEEFKRGEAPKDNAKRRGTGEVGVRKLMENDKYVGYIEGYIATTNVDSHGDKLTHQAIVSMAKQIENNPKLRVLCYNHDMNQPMGYITNIFVVTEGEWSGIKIEAGIYKDRPDLWQKIKSGEISGFSYGAKVSDWEDSGMEKEECSFLIEVEPSVWHDVSNLLSQMGARTTYDVRKAIDFPVVINVVTGLLALPGTIYGLYALVKKLNKRNQTNKDYIKVKTTKRVFSFRDKTVTVEEIITEIEANSK